MASKTILVLRTCEDDGTSSQGFVWPKCGPVEAPDWKPTNECGHGLHGLPWGVGDGSLLDWSSDARWLVVRVSTDKRNYRAGVGELAEKCKFRRGAVVFCGDRKAATDYLLAHGASDKPVVGCYKTGGNGAVLTGGYGAVLTGGDRAVLTGGDRAVLTGGNWAVLTGGNWAALTGGYRAVLTGGDGAVLTGGNGAVLTGGYGAVLTGGYGAVLTGGNWAALTWRILEGNYYRLHTVYVGEGGFKPNVAYRWEDGYAVAVESADKTKGRA